MNAVPTISDGDLLAIYRCRDFGRLAVARIHAEQLPPVHAAHALLSECMAMLIGCSIEDARAAATDVLAQLIQQAADKLADHVTQRDQKPAGKGEQSASVDGNVIAFEPPKDTNNG
jgi:hypothetical protein